MDFEMKYRLRICYFDVKEFVETYYLMRKERRYVVFNLIVMFTKQCESKIRKGSTI